MRFMTKAEVEQAVVAAKQIGPIKNAEQGAATSVWCATSAQLEGLGGVYCEDVDVAEAVAGDAQGTSGVRPWAIDPVVAERLWAASERWTGAALTG